MLHTMGEDWNSGEGEGGDRGKVKKFTFKVIR